MPGWALDRTVRLDALEYENDLFIKAPQSSVVLEFPVPRTAKVRSASATVSVTPGPQLHDESLFHFFFNDKLLETRTARDIRQKKEVVVNLPLGGEARDLIRLQIKTNMFISNDLCRDYASGGLSFTVHKDTRVNMNYDMSPIRSEADFFGSLHQGLYVVVPNNAALAEIMPAAWTYGILKKIYPHLDIQILRAGDLANKPPMPRIWVGLRNQLPSYFNKTQAGIVLVDSNTLLLSGGSTPELESLARKLPEMPFFPVNQGADKKVVVSTIANSAEKPKEGIVFGNQTVQDGILQVASNFQIYPSLLGTVPEEMGIHLEGSNMVSFEQGRPVRLDVFLNSDLVHSSVLDQSGRFSRDIVIPKNAELLTKNNLNVQFNYPEDPGQCRVKGKPQSAQIYPNSFMWGSGQRKVDHFTWSNIGLFFGRQGIVLVDEKLGEEQLKLLAGVVLMLNQQLPRSIYAFPAGKTLADQVFIPTDQYVVVLAMAGNVPPFLQDILPRAQGKNVPGYATPIEHQANINSVLGKIAANKGFPVIVLTSNFNGNLMAGALRYFSQSLHYSGLKGNIMTFQQPGQVFSLDIREGDKGVVVAQTAVQGRFVRFWEQYKTEIVIIGAGIVGLFLFFLIFHYFKKRRAARTRENYGYEDEDEEGQEERFAYDSTPKRRGRPVKSVPAASRSAVFVTKPAARKPEPATVRSAIFVTRPAAKKPEPAPVRTATVVVAKSVANKPEAASEKLPRRRGRPKKSTSAVAKPAAVITKTITKKPQPAQDQLPKRRGRPGKGEPITAQATARITEITAEPSPKRRGRPKKNVIVVAENMEKVAQITVESNSKRRGRPPQKNTVLSETINKMPELIVIPAPKLRRSKK